MKLKIKTLLGISLFALSAQYSGAAVAAPSQCSVAGIVSGGGQLQGDTLSSSSGGNSLNGSWGAMFGEAAGLVTCDAWNFQADFADHAHQFSARGKSFNAPEAHFGGDIFWRDPRVGDFGLQASYVSQTSVFNIADANMDLARVGLFGNYYLNDAVSVGMGAHYFTGLHNTFRMKKGGGKSTHGFEVSADAKYYLTPDLKVTLAGDFMRTTYNFPTGTLYAGGAAATLQADYQFSDNGLTGFIGGRLAHRVLWADTGSGNANLDDRQVYVGLSLPLGAKPGSLAEHDRTGPVNNTSTFLEEVPGVFDEAIGAALQK